jgi:uncharacterized membrane protein
MKRLHLVLLLVLGFILRLGMLRLDFWYDENFSIVLARLPFLRMLDATAGDVHPPLFYSLLWLWEKVSGSGPLWLMRLPSLAISLLAIYMLSKLTAALKLSPRVQLISVVIMTIVPFQIYYAAETRMYALLGLLTIAATWAMLERRWVLLAVFSAALMYTHNWGLFYVAAIGLLTLRTWPREWKKYLPAYALAALAWLPWGLTLVWQMGAINQSYWLTRVTLGLVALQLHQQVWAMVLYNPLGAMLTFVALLLGLYFTWRNARAAFPALLLMYLAPLLMAVTVSILWQPVLLFRAMAGISPFAYILIAHAVEQLFDGDKVNLRRALLAAIFIIPMFISAYKTMYLANLRNDGGTALDYIDAHWQAGDIILSSSDGQYVNFMNYTTHPLYLLTECQPPLGALTMRTRNAMGFHFSTYADLPARRVWFMNARTPLLHSCNLEQSAAIIGNTQPVFIDQDEPLIYSGIWLVEK